MKLSTAVLSRFSAPTCSLEIKANRSPLSSLLGNNVLKNVRFRLYLQKNSETQEKISLRGNREQLEKLRVAVDDYIQNFLTSSPESLSPTLTVDISAESLPEPEINTSGDDIVLFPNVELTEEEEDSVPTEVVQTTPKTLEQPASSQPIIRSHHFSHELFLGTLASETTGTSLMLSFLQLRDLATVLSDYHTQITALPDTTQSSATPAKNPAILFGSAAAILVAVGITTYAVRMGQSPTSVEGDVASLDTPADNPDELTFADPSLIEVPPLELPPNGEFPTPTPPAGLETIPSPDQTSILPPTAPSASGETPATSSPSLLQEPRLPNRNPQQQTRPPRTSASLPAPPPTGLALPTLPSQGTAPIAPAPQPQPSAVPSLPQARTTPPQLSPRVPSNPPNLPDYAPPPDSVQSLYDIATGSTSANPPDAGIPNQAQSIPTPNPSPSPTPPAERDNIAARGEALPQTAAVNLPQVAEVQSYFEQRWQPPANLDEPLEYILYLGRDGALERILPVGEISKTYIDQSNIPLLGESFVSSLNQEGTPQVRVVLKPDGEVETFLESVN